MLSCWSSRSVIKRTGHCAAGKGASCARAALLISLAALSLAGCSTAAPLPNSGLISTFAAAAPRQAAPPVEVEDDGREAQRPPLARMFPQPDDPTQPFSPNYGEIPLPQSPDDANSDGPPAPA